MTELSSTVCSIVIRGGSEISIRGSSVRAIAVDRFICFFGEMDARA
jgi:hypothetical protein